MAYEADLVYCLPVVYFFVSAIALFTLVRLLSAYAPASIRSPGWQRCVSACRFLSYKSWRLGGWTSQPLGVVLLTCAGAVFLAALTLGPKPYYWPTDAHYGNSPPIATRTGWLALACLPFILALGAKANMVTALTGVPPEKLNVWHNYISWAMFVLALIHTFPFIIFHNTKGDTAEVFRDGGVWLTGAIAIIAQAWLTFMSISWIRNRWYEFFKVTHYFFAATFVVFFFLHCAYRMTSWDYFIAAGAIYLASLLYAVGRTLIKHGIRHTAHLRLETPDALRISVSTPSSWRPAQHVYLRFLACGAHALTAHPLTVCSLPEADSKRGGEMVFYVQPRGGLTRRLAGMARKQPGLGVTVLLEGPYGGMPERWARGFDRTLLVAGGSGCGFTLALVDDWVRRRVRAPERELKVVLATRGPGMRNWYLNELRSIVGRLENDIGGSALTNVAILIHETNEASEEGSARSGLCGDDNVDGIEKGSMEPSVHGCESPSSTLPFPVHFLRGRPDTAVAVKGLALDTQEGSTVGVAVCGPSGMIHDVGAEAAAQQQRILRGRSGVSEVWFHKEAFS
ncbi:Flavoprotein transmembrane component [Purpureocillium lavendulum]|uniref:ferric-chelate reductase (NADPH) n=1 Tax=Purpureocillium lavendulum TaxID=1247861 RepID=A0AB34G507_9HYPO|nr:Flavoprotein transmembrane component [Purpureocillium lavendulum]